MFDKDRYLEMVKNKKTRSQAVRDLEDAISKASISDRMELKNLRLPGTVTLLELNQLKAAGFDQNKKHNGEPVILLLAFKAGAEHAKKHWPELADFYSMDDYEIPEV